MVRLTADPVAAPEIRFDADVPEVVRAEVAALWPYVSWLIPRWCRDLTFRWRPTARNGETCETTIDCTYAYAYIYLTGLWLDDDTSWKLHSLCHELVHLWFEPLAAHTRDTLNTLLEDDARLCEIVRAETRHRLEMSVQELSRVLTERFLKGENK